MRIDRETRKRPVQLVALGGPADGRLIVLRDRWGEAVVDSIDDPGWIPPRRTPIPTTEPINVRRTVYTVAKVRADRNVMTRRGGETYRVLVPAGIAAYPELVNGLLAAHGRPSVDGGHRHGKTDRPGDGCTRDDLYRFPHEHRCHDCGTVTAFAAGICKLMPSVPLCGCCGSTDWRPVEPAPAFPDWIYR